MRAFAAASSAGLRLVLESCTDIFDFEVPCGLEHAIPSGGGSDSCSQRSNLSVRCRLPSFAQYLATVRVPLHATALIYSTVMPLVSCDHLLYTWGRAPTPS